MTDQRGESAGPKVSTGMLGVILVVVLGLIAALVVSLRDSSSEPDPTAADGGAVTVGPSGGTIAVNTETGAELTLDIPAGAVATDVDISVTTRPVAWDSVADMAIDQPASVQALADHAVNDDDSLIHPLYGPVVLPSNSQLAATEIVLEPDGLQFAEPALLTVPAAEFGLAAGDEVLLFVQSEGDWEVHDLGIVPATGELAIDIEHFSTDKFIKILGNMWDNPMMHPSRQAYRNALDVLYEGPLETQAATIQRALACGTDRKFNASSIPPFKELLLYLASDGGAGISTAPAGAMDRIRDQLVAIADATRAPGMKIQDWAATHAPHNVDLGTLVSMAMRETNNDVFQALVLAHDVLRRNRENVRVQGVMANVRGDGGDERGGRYHILGVAIYSFAYQHQKQTTGGSWWAPTPETAVLIEEAWVSGTINSDTEEYALDRYSARLGRTLLDDYQLTDEERRELCDYLNLVIPTTTTTSTTMVPTTTTTSTTTTTTTTTTSTTVPVTVTVPEGLGGGDVQATLQWTGDTDMDLHVIDPHGSEIFYSVRSSPSGGELDHDDIPSCGSPSANVENIYWPADGAPSGEYSAFVYAYRNCDGPQTVQLTVQVNGSILHQGVYTLGNTGDSTPPFVFRVD